MEEKRRPGKRTLHRSHVVSRLEDEIWALVYQQFKSRTAAATPRRRRSSGTGRPAASSLPAAFAKGA
jgi:hypothetical protein